MSLEDILALLVSGVTMGAVYAMVAVSLNIAFKPTNVFNLAQGEFVMLGAMFAWGLMTGWSLPWLAGTALVLVAAGALGLLEERLAVAPLLANARHHHGWIISTLAFSIVVLHTSDRVYGTDPQAVPPVPGASLDMVQIGALTFSTQQVAVIVLAALSIAAVEWFYRSTLVGKAVLAVAEDRDGARLNGISPLTLTMGSFAVAAAYSAFTGVIAAPLVLASTSIGMMLLVKGFMALAIGGVGNNWGALAGGMLVGCVESLSSVSATPGYRQVLLLAVVLALLLVRPHGLAGARLTREV
ncbi:branched-chain amino acid ABC transporter permease [Chelatococcus reniformis]|uniref:Branched-chain amino acid ABC transporter permease n=1 Tax=Chelatococcus reniformis TaxID=1494448 RepID=A0A916U9J5_9HYPH|nr:branched-chain amino acid ABC transporter permease [Chelatococcus reniformis]GGC65312.1 branched-chain amino acid ABC transporter permease [Chelatococcus reniformis]